MGRKPNTEQRRAQIVQGLKQVMAQHGYERASIGAIAQAAGLAQGLVHYHFDSKKAILIELVRQLGAQLAARGRTEGTPRERLEAWLQARVALGPGADPEAVACWVAIGAEAARQSDVQAVYVEALQHQRSELEQLLGEAGLAEDRRPVCAAGFLALIEGAYLLGTAAPQVGPRGFASAAVTAMLAAVS